MKLYLFAMSVADDHEDTVVEVLKTVDVFADVESAKARAEDFTESAVEWESLGDWQEGTDEDGLKFYVRETTFGAV